MLEEHDDGDVAASADVREEVEQLPDGRTIRFFSWAEGEDR